MKEVVITVAVILGIIGLFSVFIVGVTNSDRCVKAMVLHGADPIAARCSVANVSDAICVSWVIKNNK